jgi:hypothetical protein
MAADALHNRDAVPNCLMALRVDSTALDKRPPPRRLCLKLRDFQPSRACSLRLPFIFCPLWSCLKN